MAVRNFWLEADIDGAATLLKGGPRAKDGGMTIRLYMRNEGRVAEALSIHCSVGRDDELRIFVEPDARDQLANVEYNDGMLQIRTQRDDPDRCATRAAAIARANSLGAPHVVIANAPKDWIVTAHPWEQAEIVHRAG